MKNKKGFTLIELLAVIVIMAILALIAIPIVINIISDSRENANKQSIINYARAVEKDVVTWKGEDTKRQFTDYEDVYKERDIKVSGNKVKCDKAIVDKEGELTLKKCYLVKYENDDNKKLYDYINGQVYESESDEALVSEYASLLESNYKVCKQNSETSDYLQCALNKMNESEIECAEKTFDSEGKAILKSCYRKGTEESKRKYYNYENGKSSKTEGSGNSTSGTSGNNTTIRETYTAYNIGDEIIVAGEQYYVISYSDEYRDYVTALKAEPLTYQTVNHYNTNGSLYIENNNGYGNIEFGNMFDPLDGNYLYENSNVKNIVDNWESNTFANTDLREVDGYRARLINKNELIDLGCYGNGRLYCKSTTYSWLYNNSFIYWTQAIGILNETSNEYGILSVINDGNTCYESRLYGYCTGYSSISAIRPVINVYKSSI